MLREQIKNQLKKAIKENIEIEVFVPQNDKFGHYSTNVALKLGKILKKNPMELANEIKSQLGKQTGFTGLIDKTSVESPGFINFWLSTETIQKEFVEIFKAKKNWGRPRKKLLIEVSRGKPFGSDQSKSSGKKKIIVIDYSHPNIAKPMSVAHLRSTIIGQALYNIFRFSGWKVVGDNHLGDWGKQFGILITAYKEKLTTNNQRPTTKKITIKDLMKLYVDYTSRMESDPKLEDAAREETKKLQEGNKENIKIWKEFYRISLEEFKKIYKILGVKFDYYLGESFYAPMLPEIIRDALKKGVAKKSQKAIVIFTDKDKPPFIIQKADEAYLYSTTDIAAIKYRVKKFKPDTILYVVDNGQSLHFEQLFKSVKMLSYDNNVNLIHVKFGLILSEDMKKLSTRAGRHISLEDLLNETIIRAKKIVNKKQPSLSEKEKNKIAEIVGIGALKYNDLSQNRQSDITFKWEKMLNFEGNSAPYLLYAYARLKSILRKARFKKYDSKFTKHLTQEIELKLIRDLDEFPDIIKRAVEIYYSHNIAEYLFSLAAVANSFYHELPVLKAKKGEREARLALIGAISQTLKTGLNLLGIEVLEKM